MVKSMGLGEDVASGGLQANPAFAEGVELWPVFELLRRTLFRICPSVLFCTSVIKRDSCHRISGRQSGNEVFANHGKVKI